MAEETIQVTMKGGSQRQLKPVCDTGEDSSVPVRTPGAPVGYEEGRQVERSHFHLFIICTGFGKSAGSGFRLELRASRQSHDFQVTSYRAHHLTSPHPVAPLGLFCELDDLTGLSTGTVLSHVPGSEHGLRKSQKALHTSLPLHLASSKGVLPFSIQVSFLCK